MVPHNTQQRRDYRNVSNQRDNCNDLKIKFDESWITDGPDKKEVIEFAEEMAKNLKKVSSSQLRNIYGEIIRIKMNGYENEKTAFLLLKPKVAYNYGRLSGHEKNAFKIFKECFFDKAHEQVKNEETFKHFAEIFEAILAYHKFYEK